MTLDKNILKKIKNIKFSKFEPTSEFTLWAKPTKGNSYAFLVFNNGSWQPLSFSGGGGGGPVSWNDIENKPDFATVATSGSYNDLNDKPTIPDVTGKADKVASATSGHLAGLNASGNLTDSGIVPSTLVYQGANQGTVPSVSFDPETDTVHVTAQTLSAAQQAQVRANIGVTDVSGTNDGTNWTSITIGSTTKAIPSGGGGGGEANVIESISINGTTQTVTSKNVDLPVPTSTAVTQIVSISQSAYDALATKDSATLYLITS